jgi:hypothetical protein
MSASYPTCYPITLFILTLTLSTAKGNGEESPHLARVAAPLRWSSPFQARTTFRTCPDSCPPLVSSQPPPFQDIRTRSPGKKGYGGGGGP